VADRRLAGGGGHSRNSQRAEHMKVWRRTGISPEDALAGESPAPACPRRDAGSQQDSQQAGQRRNSQPIGHIRPWIEALRLRTLPLSLAGAIIASGCAVSYNSFRPEVCALLVLTVLLLQVLSNFADEYGDLQKGADNDARIGPVRAMQRGEISFSQMRRALIALAFVTFASGIALVLVALGLDPLLLGVFLALGVLVLFAAIGYTVGKRAYGYYGLGDAFCLLCFGWLAVCGGFFLYAHYLTVPVALAATGVGLLVVGVLNLNNMRDRLTDADAGKKTLVVRIGARAARVYHSVLLLGGFALLAWAMTLLALPQRYALIQIPVFLLGLIPLGLNLKATLAVREPKDYDRLMRPLALLIILLSLAFALLVSISPW
jgi:1,4-dihydroxy-2-naphthoate octaprenyltransferase